MGPASITKASKEMSESSSDLVDQWLWGSGQVATKDWDRLGMGPKACIPTSLLRKKT